MAPRSRMQSSSDDVDRSYESSPDPLALSLNENTARSTRQTSPRKPFKTTSPSKQNRRSSVSEMEFSSPSKSMVVNTPRMGSASPWRIKVTVQAEPGSDDESADSPSVKRVTRTKTTTVPLRDPDAPTPMKRGRGRPRKSDIGVATKPKRNGTPAKRAARSKSRDASVAAAEPAAIDANTEIPAKKKRGRPRKSIQLDVEEPRNMAEEEQDDHNIPATEATAAATENITNTSIEQGTPHVSPQQIEHQIPVVDTPAGNHMNRRIHTRRGTPHAKKASTTILVSGESDEESDVLTPASEDEEDELPAATQDFHAEEISQEENMEDRHPLERSDMRLDTHGAVDNVVTQDAEQPFETDAEDDGQDDINFAFDEGTTRMPDDTTVLDSENFSMISVASLPSSGGLTSPPRPEDSNSNNMPRIDEIVQTEPSKQNASRASPSQPQMPTQPSPATMRNSGGLHAPREPIRPAIRRYITPVVDSAVPSVPPAIEAVQPALPKNETPRLGRVVTAGVALQGVLDPARLTPGPTQKVLDEERDRLDDLFRGFSEGTRKELQAGLRLGEQLAQDNAKERPSPAVPSPIKVSSNPQQRLGVFKTERKVRQSRLLTPEDQDDYANAPTMQTESDKVQYPQLEIQEPENTLLSPARSEGEMSWRVDTPPVTTGNTERMRLLSVCVDQAEHNQQAGQTNKETMPPSVQPEDYEDIWQEEASRSSDSLEDEAVPQVQDLFEPGPVAPARGKLPRTWRRKSGNHFQYSDEAESPQQPTAVSKGSAEPEVMQQDFVEDIEGGASEDEDGASEASDDTGVFFQSNLPHLFNKRRSRELKQKKADKLDLTLLMNEGESLAPESSPPVQAKKSSSATKNNPFLDTPPRFAGYLSSPQKGSPLRQELRGSDISSQSPSHFQEESSLPLVQSSPFHTYVDQSMLSVASDQRQLYQEMEGVTDSSIRRVRNEANDYLDAYEPQERSLHEIEEVTEHSRTWHRQPSAVASSPPQMKMLSPVRKRVPLFGIPDRPKIAADREPEVANVSERGVQDQTGSSSSPTQEQQHAVGQAQQRPTGLLTRMTSTLWSAVSRPATTIQATTSTPPPPHPILAKLAPLPKIEPWTKTHYKTLDKLYSLQFKRPEFFTPSASPPTAITQTNKHLLNKFLSATKKPYVGAKFSAWGYEMDMTEELVVLCAIFVELLSLGSIAEYEALKGREIELGECAPGKAGEMIEAEEVVRRLATVVLGEEVRKDEKRGLQIDRSKGLEVEWPQ